MNRLTGQEIGGMPTDIRARLFALRCRSKRGEYLPPDNVQFMNSCWEKWPAEYAAMDEQIREATLPLGART